MHCAPVALFTYNRLWHTQQTVLALQKNHHAAETELFVFSDGPGGSAKKDDVQAVRDYIKTITGFRQVTCIERESNLGLANSIISGVTSLLDRFDRIIVLEDDLVTSPFFLEYMNNGLECYRDQDQVISIHAYRYPVTIPLPETFFLKGADCWGWGTWKRGWKLFEPDGMRLLDELRSRNLTDQFDYDGTYGFTKMLENQVNGKNDSWAIRWHAAAFLQDKLTLYPGTSLVYNTGLDASGIHCASIDDYSTVLSSRSIDVRPIPLAEDLQCREAFKAFFSSLEMTFFKRIDRYLRRLVKS